MLARSGLHAASHTGPGLLARTVLLVEDEELVRSTVAAALADEGFHVLEAGSAEEGLELLEQRPVGVLFTDIRLPGPMDGWRFAEAARALYPTLPVVYATGYSVEAPRLVRGGVFLRKPYLPSVAIETIERLIGQSGD